MPKKSKNNPSEDPSNETEKDAVIEAETVKASEETKADQQHKTADSKKEHAASHIDSDMLTRILLTLIFALIGWLSLWVFGFVVLMQFGFLLITGTLNKNLKAFNGELGEYLSDVINFVGFQSDEKPFPFQVWHYDDDKKTENTEPAQ